MHRQIRVEIAFTMLPVPDGGWVCVNDRHAESLAPDSLKR
jgi:hypothetical protein